MLKDKVAVIYGAAGNVGSAIAAAFARAGAIVHVTGRNAASVHALAKEIDGHAAVVDALDESAVRKHLDEVVARHRGVDISFNAVGIAQHGIQGIPLAELTAESFALPIATYTRAHFITAQAAARHMVERHSGVLLMHTPEPARFGAPLVGGMGPMWAALEAMTRAWSAELAARGVRAVCLRTTGLPQTSTIDVVFGLHARAIGIERAQFQDMMEARAHRQRSSTLAELASAAVFAASDAAIGLTGTTLNLTGGAAVD